MKLATLTYTEEDYRSGRIEQAINRVIELLERFNGDEEAVMRYLKWNDRLEGVRA